MARQTLRSQRYLAARASDNARTPTRTTGGYADRIAKRRVYSASPTLDLPLLRELLK